METQLSFCHPANSMPVARRMEEASLDYTAASQCASCLQTHEQTLQRTASLAPARRNAQQICRIGSEINACGFKSVSFRIVCYIAKDN